MHLLKASTLASVLIIVAFLSGCDGAPTAVSEGIRVVPFADYQADGRVHKVTVKKPKAR